MHGRVWYCVPWIGYVNQAVNGENRAWIIPIIAGALFLYAGYMVASGIAGGREEAPAGEAASGGTHRDDRAGASPTRNPARLGWIG